MTEHTSIGKIQSVDTGSAIIQIDDDEHLNNIQVNQIVFIRSTNTNEKIVGLVSKIMRKGTLEQSGDFCEGNISIENFIRTNLVGTSYDKLGVHKNVFKRTLNVVPSVGSECWLLQGEELTNFMGSISSDSKNPLTIGAFSIAENSPANLDGNKFFQRHAVIVGGTGSGKSWTVAKILEKASLLKSLNCIVFDLHGEYKPLSELNNSILLKIAGPTDTPSDDTLFLPYWLLSYEEIESMILDRSDTNAPNQSRALFDLIVEYKKQNLKELEKQDILNAFTIESPVPYKIEDVLDALEKKDKEMVQGAKAGSKKQGALNGKLTRFIQRLKSKISDKRLNFIFNKDDKLLRYEWLNDMIVRLVGFGNKTKGLKIIDFSEVPSDILPLITGLIGRVVFSIYQWMPVENRKPIALFCDEAHLYMPAETKGFIEEKGLLNFERIAKEGRKYGVSLVVISQRPSDVSKTILSQCGNFIAMRLTNPDDQNVIRKLFPDNLGNFSESLPILDSGECLIVGDACLLPSRVKVDEPQIKPSSATIDFWNEWSKEVGSNGEDGIFKAIDSLRKQQK